MLHLLVFNILALSVLTSPESGFNSENSSTLVVQSSSSPVPSKESPSSINTSPDTQKSSSESVTSPATWSTTEQSNISSTSSRRTSTSESHRSPKSLPPVQRGTTQSVPLMPSVIILLILTGVVLLLISCGLLTCLLRRRRTQKHEEGDLPQTTATNVNRNTDEKVASTPDMPKAGSDPEVHKGSTTQQPDLPKAVPSDKEGSNKLSIPSTQESQTVSGSKSGSKDTQPPSSDQAAV